MVDEEKYTTSEELPKNLRVHACWRATALCIGYNELVKKAETLAEKVYFRLARDMAEEELREFGGGIEMKRGEPILVLPVKGMPPVLFTDADIELMRAAVSAHDAKKAPPVPEAVPSDKACLRCGVYTTTTYCSSKCAGGFR